MRSSLIYFLFLFIFYLYIPVDGFYYLDKTIPGSNDIYSVSSSCNFNFKFLIGRDPGDSDISVFKITPELIYTPIRIGINDNNEVLYRVILIVSVNELSSFQIVINTVTLNPPIQFECLSFPSPIINLNSNTVWRTYSNQVGLYKTFLKLNLVKSYNILPITAIQSPYNLNNSCEATNQYSYEYLIISCKLGLLTVNQLLPQEIEIIITNPITNLIDSIRIPTFLTNSSTVPSLVPTVDISLTAETSPYKEVYYSMSVTGYNNNYISSSNEVSGVYHLSSITYGNESEKHFMVHDTYLPTERDLYFYQTIISQSYYPKSYQLQSIDFTLAPIFNPMTSTPATSTSLYDGILTVLFQVDSYFKSNLKQQISSQTKTGVLEYPYGIVLKNHSTKAFYQIEIYKPNNMGNSQLTFQLATNAEFYFAFTTNGFEDKVPPSILYNISYIPLEGMRILIRLTGSDDLSGFFSIQFLGEDIQITSKDLVSGDLLYGVYEKYFDYTEYLQDPVNDYPSLDISDYAGNHAFTPKENLPNPFPLFPYLISRNLDYEQYKRSIIFLRFTFNNIDLSEIGVDNTLFVSFNNSDKYQIIKFVIEGNIFKGKWSDKFQMYLINFRMEARPFGGIMPYKIYYQSLEYVNDILPESYQLKVISKYADRMPPIITHVQATDLVDFCQWELTIEDSINGFSHGIIHVTSEFDPLPYIFQLSPNSTQNIYLDKYIIQIPIPKICQAQTYSISYVELYDTSGVKSVYNDMYNIYNNPNYNVISPFMKMLGDLIALTIQPSCTPPNDGDAPLISSINSIYGPFDTPINTATGSAKFGIQFEIYDSLNISTRHLPTCYLESVYFERISTLAVLQSVNQPHAIFVCDFQIPYGFSLNSNAIFSIYGFSDIAMNIGGYAPSMLLADGKPYLQLFQFDIGAAGSTIQSVFPLPILESDSKLTIVGKLFNSDSKVVVNYIDDTAIVSTPIFKSSSVLVIQDLQFLSKQIVSVMIQAGSNVYFVGPYEMPPIINCPGNPKCGGPSNGDCDALLGCVCKAPWFGLDCLSQNVIVTPIINTTNPSVETGYNTILPDGKQVALKSLISVLSLREVKTQTSEIVNEYIFTDWIYSNTTDLVNDDNIQEFTYTTNITSVNNQITFINVKVQYFKDSAVIYFANEKLNILPSTVKYNIELSAYSFTSELNALELMIYADIQSASNDSCSLNESGNSNDGSDSNYIKLQINSHSLYGRFIKRGIVDNRIQSVSNKIYNTSNQQTTETSSSLIGIQIPHYKLKIELDPDFSILVDTQDASLKENSICNTISDTDDGGLTKTQLIGIIVGSIAVGIVLLIVTVTLLYHHNIFVRIHLKKVIKLKSKFKSKDIELK